jgi:hypothetical protein
MTSSAAIWFQQAAEKQPSRDAAHHHALIDDSLEKFPGKAVL